MSNFALFADTPWIAALAWSLLHFLWQGSLVGLVFALVRKAIPKHQCNARYLNGLLTLLALALLPAATFFILLAGQIAPINGSPAMDGLWPMAQSAGGVESANESLDAYLQWIVAVWLVGVMLVSLRSWRQWRNLVQVARQWAIPDERLQELMATLTRRFGFARDIRVLVSDRIETPTLIGWIKPLVLMPTAVALGFPMQQIELILAHELGHLRRHDHLVNLAQALLETLLFYHPVVHWVAREVRNEREICCDEMVLRVTKGDPREYAGALTALEELRQPPVRLVLAASGGILLERVRRILFASRVETARFGMRLWLPLLVLVVVVLSAAVRVERSESVAVDMPLASPAAIGDSRLVLNVSDLAVASQTGQSGLVAIRNPKVEKTALPARMAAPAYTAPEVVASAPALQIGSSVPAVALLAPNVLPERVPVLVRTVSTESPDESARGRFNTKTPEAIAEQATYRIRDDGRFRELGLAARGAVAADLERIEGLLHRKGSAAKLNDRERLELMNAQERIEALLAKNEDDRLICTLETRTGTKFKVTICQTASQREEIRRKSQQLFNVGISGGAALVMR